MVRTPSFHCQGPGFSPCLRNLDWKKKKKEQTSDKGVGLDQWDKVDCELLIVNTRGLDSWGSHDIQ